MLWGILNNYIKSKSDAVDWEDQRNVFVQQVEKSSIFHNFIFEYFLLTIISIHCISVQSPYKPKLLDSLTRGWVIN